MGKNKTYSTSLFSGFQAKRAYSTTYTNTEVMVTSSCGGCNSYCIYGPNNFTCNNNSYSVYYNSPNYNTATNVCIYMNGTKLGGNPPCCCMSQIWPNGNQCAYSMCDKQSQFC